MPAHETFDGDPTSTYHYRDEEQTPATARTRVAAAGNQLVLAELALRRTRDEEVAAAHEYESAFRQLLLARSTPKAGRGSGSVTVSERDAWINERLADLVLRVEVTKAATAAAVAHYKRVDTQCSLAQSLLSSIDKATARGLAHTDGIGS